jgi:hypothetical protein
MRRIVALILLFTVLLLPMQNVHAQGGPSLSSVEVLIWPEYDQPSVLVIYHITVSPETSLPTTMTFRIPAAAIKPTVVAMGQAVGAVTDQGIKYSVNTEGEWVKIAIEVTAPVIQLEYYDPTILRQSQSRQFSYIWPADYPVQSMHVELQRPFDASQMESTPALPNESAQPNDLTYYTGDFGPFTAGDHFSLDVKYQKKTDTLSVSLMPVDSQTVDSSTTGRVSISTYLPWLIGLAGVLLIMGGLYYYFRGQPRTKPARRRRSASASGAVSQDARYCPQCGTRARPGDRFCRTCGSRIRTGDED